MAGTGLSGRTGLVGFWVGLVILAALYFVLTKGAAFIIPAYFGHVLPLETAPRAATLSVLSMLAAIIALLLPLIWLMIRRLNDRARSGLWIIPAGAAISFLAIMAPGFRQGLTNPVFVSLSALAAVFLIWIIIETAFIPGKQRS